MHDDNHEAIHTIAVTQCVLNLHVCFYLSTATYEALKPCSMKVVAGT